MGGLETVDGDILLPAVAVDGEELLILGDDPEGASIGGAERRLSSGPMPDIDKTRAAEVYRQMRSVLSMELGLWWESISHRLPQVAEETGGMLRRTRGFEELAGEVERCAIDEIGRGAVGVLSPGRADAQHDHGQLVHPVRAGEAGREGALQLPV